MSSGRRGNSLLETWALGGLTLGAACKIPSSFSAEALAAAGFDYVYVDQQHGLMDNPSMLSVFQGICAAGCTPVTRVPVNQPDAIGMALDLGAMGVMVPDVESATEAERAVAACRFPPRGTRSYGLMRSQIVFDSPRPQVLESVACIVMVESAAGLANLGEIAATEGVDAIMVGPNDLALSLGVELGGDWMTSEMLTSAIEQIRMACGDHKLVAGIGVPNGAAAVRWARQGFRMINIGNDLGYLRTNASREVAAFRSAYQSDS
jgi:4-hydroxy-2-oxoheptanedioate aldolase